MTDDLPARLLCAKLAIQAACERADRAEERCRELEAQLAVERRTAFDWFEAWGRLFVRLTEAR